MKLRRFTDYALRVLIYAAGRPGRLCSLPEIATAHRVSGHHLMKAATHLGHLGYLDTVRGRNGGVRLSRPPDQIRLGELVRELERGDPITECKGCVLATRCQLVCALDAALAAFYASLDNVSLRDLLPSDSITM